MKWLVVWAVCLASMSSFASVTLVPKETDVVIIGAGLSGLATAYELKKQKIRYHILELTQRVGGRVRTVHYQRPGEPEIYADSGMEEYWESNPAVRILKELKLPMRNDVAVSSLVLQNKLIPLGDETPQEFQKRLFNEDERKSLAAFKSKVAPLVAELNPEKLPRPELLKLKNVSFKDWVEEQKMPAKVNDWIRVSIECEIGTHWERISALDGIAEFHIFLGDGERSYRVTGGNEKFTDGLAGAVGKNNISLNKKVNRVSSNKHGMTISYLDTEKNVSGVIKAKHVVSTIPLFRLIEIQFEPPLSEKKREAISTMAWGSYFKVHVFVPSSAEKFWTKDKGSILPILSDSELGVIYDGNPDQKGGTRIISLLVTGDDAEKFNMMPLDQVKVEIKAAFEKLWSGFTKEIKEIEFYRFHPRAIAAWPVGRSRYDEGSLEIRRQENNVYLAGDFTENSHSDGAFISASRVVRQITKGNR